MSPPATVSTLLNADPSQQEMSADILLIEDDEDDAELVQGLLKQYIDLPYNLKHAHSLGEGGQWLQSQNVDLVLLDLNLPDSRGAQTVREIYAAHPQSAIVVISSSVEDDVQLEAECLRAGAQDLINKSDLDGARLARAVGYSLIRIRQNQLREVQEMLARYRTLSSEGQGTSVTSALSGQAPLSARMPHLFAAMVEDYRTILRKYMKYVLMGTEKPLTEMEQLITLLGDQGSGPRDLLDIHIRVVGGAKGTNFSFQQDQAALHGRLLALEMMGLLVNYYRIGTRRR